MSQRLITTLRSYVADTKRQCIDGDIPMPKPALLNIVEAMEDAANDLESRRSMVEETVRAIRGGDVMVKPEELRAFSKATAILRDLLDITPADLPGRSLVLEAQQQVLQVLESINARDTSWH